MAATDCRRHIASSKGVLAIPSRVIAACFALVSFAAALIVGWSANNPASTILQRALVIMLVCYVIGRVVGQIAQQTVDQHIEKYKQDHPAPDAQQQQPADGANFDIIDDEPAPAQTAEPTVTERNAA